MFTHQMLFPNKILLGKKAISNLGNLSENNIFIISSSFIKKNQDIFTSIVKKNPYIQLSGEPTQEHIDRITEKINSTLTEHIIAIGGGSIIDAAKIVKTNLKKKLTVVPTTIGSGAEVSQYSLLIDPSNKNKKVAKVELPDLVIIDSDLYKTFTKQEIAYQAIDAIAHAIESLVSRFSNSLSDFMALVALENICVELETYHSAEDIHTLEKIKIASTIAGLAQSSAGTGLVHAFAHYLGSHHAIPHAHAISMVLIPVLKLNLKRTDKYKKLDSLKSINVDSIIPQLEKIYKMFAISSPSLKLTEDTSIAANSIRKDVCTISNPFSPSVEDITQILDQYA